MKYKAVVVIQASAGLALVFWYGQAQVCSKGHQGSSVDRPCQPCFQWIKFWHGRNPLPQSIRLRLSVLVRDWAGQGE